MYDVDGVTFSVFLNFWSIQYANKINVSIFHIATYERSIIKHFRYKLNILSGKASLFWLKSKSPEIPFCTIPKCWYFLSIVKRHTFMDVAFV